MTKLPNKRVKFAVKRVFEGEATCQQVAQLYGVSVRRVQQLVRQYKKTKEMPVLKKNRRPKKLLTDEEKRVIDKAYEQVRLCAFLLKPYIKRHYGVKISHNKIHEYLKEKERAKPDPKKQKQRRYIRYEREHSLSLIHIDWYDNKNGKQVIAPLDDASRKILACGEFKAKNTKNAIKALKQAIQAAAEYNGFIRELNSDRDTTFMTVNKKDGKKLDNHRLQEFLRKQGIKFIPSRRRHPQTNGKEERWFQEYKKHRHRFKKLQGFIDWYNNRPHGSLDISNAETPSEAFTRKLPPECLIGLFYKNIVGE